MRTYAYAVFLLLGLFLVNDLQSPPPPSKRADGKIFLAYVSDDFKIKNKNLKNFFFKWKLFEKKKFRSFVFQNFKIFYEHTFHNKFFFFVNVFYYYYYFFIECNVLGTSVSVCTWTIVDREVTGSRTSRCCLVSSHAGLSRNLFAVMVALWTLQGLRHWCYL